MCAANERWCMSACGIYVRFVSLQTEADLLMELMGIGATRVFVAPATNRSALLPLVRARCYTLEIMSLIGHRPSWFSSMTIRFNGVCGDLWLRRWRKWREECAVGDYGGNLNVLAGTCKIWRELRHSTDVMLCVRALNLNAQLQHLSFLHAPNR